MYSMSGRGREAGRGEVEERLIKDQLNGVSSDHCQQLQYPTSKSNLQFQIAAEVSAPLAKTDEIVMISGQDRTAMEVSKLCGSLPPAISALTGVDVSGVSLASVSPPPVTTQPRPVRTISQTLNVGPLHLH